MFVLQVSYSLHYWRAEHLLPPWLSPSHQPVSLTWWNWRRKRRREIPIFLLSTSCLVTQTQAFPRQLTGSVRGLWQRDSFDVQKWGIRLRAGVGTGAGQELQINKWFLGSKITVHWLVSFVRENMHAIKRCVVSVNVAWSVLSRGQRTAREG